MEQLVIAVDLGGTNIRAAAIDQAGKIHKRFRCATQAAGGSDVVLRNLLCALEEVEKDYPPGQLRGIGLGIPGVIDIRTGTITESPNVPEWHHYPLKQRLQTSFLGGIPIILENDANVAAVGERWKGAGVGLDHLICLTLGTGIGGGIILDGKLLHGADGMAGEIGHMTIDPKGPRCACGNQGCLEALASATAIRREAIQAEKNHPGSLLGRLCQGDPGTLTAEMVDTAARAGDAISLGVFRTMGQYLGIGIANLINIFNPEAIIIGGGVSRGWDLFFPFAREEAKRRAFRIPFQQAKILPARCGDDAGLLGAAYLAFNGNL